MSNSVKTFAKSRAARLWSFAALEIFCTVTACLQLAKTSNQDPAFSATITDCQQSPDGTTLAAFYSGPADGGDTVYGRALYKMGKLQITQSLRRWNKWELADPAFLVIEYFTPIAMRELDLNKPTSVLTTIGKNRELLDTGLSALSACGFTELDSYSSKAHWVKDVATNYPAKVRKDAAAGFTPG